jgi:hypothetical protein
MLVQATLTTPDASRRDVPIGMHASPVHDRLPAGKTPPAGILLDAFQPLGQTIGCRFGTVISQPAWRACPY